MSYNFRFEDDYIEEFYIKKRQFKKLESEIELMSKNIKETLNKNGMFYSNTKHYKIFIEPRYRPTIEFIELLEKNNLDSLVTKTCTIRNFEKGCEALNLSPKDYREIWCKSLYVKKR